MRSAVKGQVVLLATQEVPFLQEPGPLRVAAEPPLPSKEADHQQPYDKPRSCSYESSSRETQSNPCHSRDT